MPFLLAVVEMNNDELIKFSWAHYSLLGPESFRVGSGLQSRNPESREVGRLDGCLESKFLLDIFSLVPLKAF